MAERALTAAMLQAIAAGALRPALFYEGEFDSGGVPAYLRLWTGVGNIDWNGNTWTGGGKLLGISAIKETTTLQAVGFQVSMAGIASADVSRALQSTRKKRSGKLWLGLFEPEIVDADFTKASITPQVGAGVCTFTCTRAGATATRVNASGLIETVAADTARFDYDPVTLACKGLLVEEARTNLLDNGDVETDAAGWGEGSGVSTLTRDSAHARHGTYSMKYSSVSAPGGPFIVQRSGSLTSVSASTDYTFSVDIYAPAASVGKQFLLGHEWHDSGGTVISVPYTTITLTAGWNRYTVTATSPVGAAFDVPFCYEALSQGTFDVWFDCAMLEAGAFETSRILTTTAAVTRNGDVVTCSDISGFYNAAGGTLYIEATSGVTDSGFHWLAQLDAAASGRITLTRQPTSGNLEQSVVSDAGVFQFRYSPTLADNSTFKIAFAFATNDFQTAKDGVLGSPDTSGTLPTVTRLMLGHAGGSQWDGHIRRFTYFPRRLPNADLVALSASAPGKIEYGARRLIADPYLLRRGRFNIAPIHDDGETATITAQYEDRLILLETPLNRRYTHEDQQLRHPGDKGFDQVPELQNAQDVWGA